MRLEHRPMKPAWRSVGWRNPSEIDKRRERCPRLLQQRCEQIQLKALADQSDLFARKHRAAAQQIACTSPGKDSRQVVVLDGEKARVTTDSNQKAFRVNHEEPRPGSGSADYCHETT